MSALALPFAMTPSVGAAGSPKGVRSDARPASDAAAFAAALDEEASVAPTTETSSTRAPQGEIADVEASNEAAVSPDDGTGAPDAPAPTPPPGPLTLPGPLPGLMLAEPDAGVAAESGNGATQGLLPSPDTPSSPVADDIGSAPRIAPPAAAVAAAAAALETAPLDDQASRSTPLDANLDKGGTPVASDRARDVANAQSAVVTPVRPVRVAQDAEQPAKATQSDPALSADEGEPAPAAAPAAPGKSEPPRTRDVIDRALAGQPATTADPDATSSGKSDGTSSKTPAPSADTAPAPGSSSSKAPVEPLAALLQPVPADEVAATTGLAPSSTADARAPEAASPGLWSTLSRAAVETTAQIAAQIVRKLEGRATRFEMALTPEGLGRVDVSLDIDTDGALHATLAFDNPVAATELRGRADELRRQLIEAGFTLTDDALSFSQRDPSAGQGGAFDRQSDPRNARAFGAASRLNVEADLSLQTPRWISLSLTPAGVDMKV